jgi:pyridoxamine 5'-phosphate oxidase
MITTGQQIPDNPFNLFTNWFNEAVVSGLPLPQAMTLATSTRGGKPSARIVLLKEVTHEGLVFFTNYKSRKSRELMNNPRAALVFFWSTLHRQIRIEGVVKNVPDELSDKYFSSRPRGSQLGAWASQQSGAIPDRDFLLREYEAMKEKYENIPVPRPPFWGGYVLVPSMFEFWQEQENRLHNRIRFQLKKGKWYPERLAP